MTFPAVRPGPGDPLREFRAWSIGVYVGPSPLALEPASAGPVLTARDVTDVDAYFVADPFMIRRDGLWHMFFEVLPRSTQKGVIAHATSVDALEWSYGSVVLAEPFHLSYPYVFESDGEVYMIPESLGAVWIRLYRATEFPGRFEPVADLIPGRWADPSVFFDAGRWWLFACSTPFECRSLHLFSADHLLGPWSPHPCNPIVADDRRRARPGGRIRHVDGRAIRFAQDCVVRYGHQVRALEILELDEARFRERECPESPVLAPSPGSWNEAGMHHVDAHRLDDGRWIACVDGDRYQDLPQSPPAGG